MSLFPALSSFGLGLKEQEVYLVMLKHSWLTALQLSRLSSIKRATLYRVLEALTEKGLVEVQLDDKTTYYRAADLKSFESLVMEQEEKTQRMKSDLSSLKAQLSLLKVSHPHQTSVHFYRGVRGLRTLEWKMCENENFEMLVFGTDYWAGALGEEFAETIRIERVARNIKIRELLNTDDIKPVPADGSASWTKNKEYILKQYKHRSVSSEVLPIDNEIIILPESLVFFSFEESQPVGIELSNQAYSSMMRHLFEVLWATAKQVDSFG